MRLLGLVAIAGALVIAYVAGRDLARARERRKIPRDVSGRTRPWFV